MYSEFACFKPFIGAYKKNALNIFEKKNPQSPVLGLAGSMRRCLRQDDPVDINLDIPSDEVEVINQAMLLDDQVDINLDTQMDLLLKNEFFQEKYLQLTAEDIQLENPMDTKEVISMVDHLGIEPEMLLDIDEDTASDTDMDDASTSRHCFSESLL